MLCKRNDLVILDASALTESADAEMLIQMPAAAILVVREDRDLVPEVVAAARTLERLAPPVVGAILNAIAIDHSPIAHPAPLMMIPARAEAEEKYQA